MKQTIQVEQVPKMNREQRRAAKHRKPQKPQYRGDPLAAPKLINMVQPFEPNELMAQHNVTRCAFERLRTGGGSGNDFNRVSMTFNMGLVISEQIDTSLVDIMIRGQAAMVRMLDRYNRGLSLGFDAAGLVDVPAAINAYEDIADTQSAMQITQAVREAYRRFDEGNVLTPAWANQVKGGA